MVAFQVEVLVSGTGVCRDKNVGVGGAYYAHAEQSLQAILSVKYILVSFIFHRVCVCVCVFMLYALNLDNFRAPGHGLDPVTVVVNQPSV